jgi:hypothetical protein
LIRLKVLEGIASFADGVFGFLDKVISKGDPVGAVKDVANSAEKQFDKLLNRERGKLKKKDKKFSKKDTKIKYSSAE